MSLSISELPQSEFANLYGTKNSKKSSKNSQNNIFSSIDLEDNKNPTLDFILINVNTDDHDSETLKYSISYGYQEYNTTFKSFTTNEDIWAEKVSIFIKKSQGYLYVELNNSNFVFPFRSNLSEEDKENIDLLEENHVDPEQISQNKITGRSL